MMRGETLGLGLLLAACTVALSHLPAFVEPPSVDSEVARAVLEDTPPRVVFVTEPTLLVRFDGAPILRRERNVVRVTNTKSLVVLYDDAYWAWVGDRWFYSRSADGVFAEANQWRIPVTVDAARILFGDDVEDSYSEERMAAVDDGAAVVGVTIPTMLVTIAGRPVFEPVPGTRFERVVNADTEVMRERDTGAWRVRVHDRWACAPSAQGPWTFEAPR